MWASSSTSASWGSTLDQGVEVHFLDDLILVDDTLAGDDFEPMQQRFRLCPPMGLDNADDDIDAGFPPSVRALKHLIGFADTGRGADEDLQPPGLAALAPGRLKQGFRQGTLFGITALLLSHRNNIFLTPRRA